MKRRTFLATAAGGIALAGGCGRPETQVSEGNRTRTLHLGNGTEPRDLDPGIATAVTDSWIISALFEGLVNVDPPTLKPLPGVAESWEVSPDGLVYTFHLRADARWSNGESVTAHDFLYAYERILTPALGSEYSYMLYVVKNAEVFNLGKLKDFAQVGFAAADARTFRITLANPAAFFLTLLVHHSWYPVNRRVIERFGRATDRVSQWTKPGNHVGNGPFVLVHWRVATVVEVRKSGTYWDRGNVGLDGIRYYPVENYSTEERMFRAGQLHTTYACTRPKIPVYRREHPELLRINPWLQTDYFRVNVTKPAFKDRRVRRAFSLALGRAALATSVMEGVERPAEAFVPPGLAGYECPTRVKPDPETARRLLAEAGYPGGRGLPPVELHFPVSETSFKVCQAIQEQWRKELGVHVSLRNEEFKVYLDSQRKLAYDISYSIWVGDYADPATYLDLLITDGGNNQTGWGNKDYDALIAEAARTLDPQRRFEVFYRAEAILLEELPVIPIFWGAHCYLERPEVKNHQASVASNILWKRVRLEPSPT